jgi:peptide/nickel transport system substrate-binding protein
MEASRIIYEPLASFDKEGHLIPFLAAEIPSLENGGVAKDGTSVTWKLREDVQWSDGIPFTADDVVFTYEYVTNPDVGSLSAFAYASVDQVEAIDDYTVKITFKQSTAAWSTPFVGLTGMIIPRHKFADYTNENAREAPANWGVNDGDTVGTGPYRVVSFKPQEVLFLGNDLVETYNIAFEPNAYFREEDKPYFSKVILRGGGTAIQAARSVFEDGTADYAYNLQITDEQLQEMEQAGKAEVLINFGSRIIVIDVNFTDPDHNSTLDHPHPFFSDKKVRQAFAYAIDREKIAEIIYGRGARATSNILVAPEEYRSDAHMYPYDPDKARQLLDEAGWKDTNDDGLRDKDGEEMRVLFQTLVNPLFQEIQEIIKDELESLGIRVELKIVDSSVFFSGDTSNPDTTERFRADLQAYDITMDTRDPSDYFGWWKCDQIPREENNWLDGFNLSRWCNPAYDKLQEQSLTEFDEEQRHDLFVQMNDIFVEDVAKIVVVHIANVSGVSKELEGVETTPWDAEVWNIKDWRRTNTP